MPSQSFARSASLRAVGVVLMLLLLSACATLPNGHRWGEDVTIAPSWASIGHSASAAVRDPWVWAPLGAAATLQVGHWDRHVSDWARRETPVFGSPAHATRWSNDLRSLSVAADFATVLFTPSGEPGAAWVVDKVKGYAVDLVGATAAVESTTLLKHTVSRERPNASGNDSLPSGHAATAAAYTRFASLNLREIDLDPGARRALDIGLQVINFGTAWARVEGGWHYPSDTLVSIGLGNFFGRFFNDAFMGLDDDRARMAFVPLRGGGMLTWQMSVVP